jgi:hypothetical protein
MESEAEKQLALITDARARLADKLTTPWWYHLSLAALVGGFVLAFGLDLSNVWRAVVVCVLLFGEGVLIGAYWNTMGVRTAVRAAFPRSTFWVTFGVYLTLVGASWAMRLWTAATWPVWALGAATVVIFVALGRWTDAVWRRRLRGAE